MINKKQFTNPEENGCERIFEDLYRLYYHKVIYFACRYVNDYSKSKSIAQDVFVTLWENRHIIDTEKNILSYILTITKNKCLNALKRRAIEQKYMDSNQKDICNLNIYALQDSSAEMLLTQELSQIIFKTIDQLPEKTKEAFYLSRNKGLKYEEIAKIMGVTVKTVEYRIMQALRVLRVKLKDYAPIILGFILIYLYICNKDNL